MSGVMLALNTFASVASIGCALGTVMLSTVVFERFDEIRRIHAEILSESKVAQDRIQQLMDILDENEDSEDSDSEVSETTENSDSEGNEASATTE